MNYREVKRQVRIAAAGHLYSLEIYDEFDEKDEDRVDRAIREIQAEIRGRSRQGQSALTNDQAGPLPEPAPAHRNS